MKNSDPLGQKPDNMKLVHREPTEREMKEFKKNFMRDMAEKHADSNVKAELRQEKMRVGQLESEVQHLEHELKKARAKQVQFKPLTKKIGKNYLKQYVRTLLNELLFLELQTGKLYKESF